MSTRSFGRDEAKIRRRSGVMRVVDRRLIVPRIVMRLVRDLPYARPLTRKRHRRERSQDHHDAQGEGLDEPFHAARSIHLDSRLTARSGSAG